MDKEKLRISRYFLKGSIRKKINFKFTDQNQGVPVPPIEKEYKQGSQLINLPGFDKRKNIPKADLTETIGNRKSHRVCTGIYPFLTSLSLNFQMTCYQKK
jgi:hypothetical protein